MAINGRGAQSLLNVGALRSMLPGRPETRRHTGQLDPKAQLAHIAAASGTKTVPGLATTVIEEFLRCDDNLRAAVSAAHLAHIELRLHHPELVGLTEKELLATTSDGFLGFYDEWSTNPYVPLAARGPWIVTTSGAVVHDSGGYGMLSFGHAPEDIVAELAHGHVMANVMTPNVEQRRFISAMRDEIGHTRPSRDRPIYDTFACLGSGSEVLGLALRITDTYAKTEIGRREVTPRAVKMVSLEGSFHGRTDRPARASASTRATYCANLASYTGTGDLVVVDPEDPLAIVAAFESARRNNEFIEAVLIEPVMGEGAPGRAVSPQCYSVARELTTKHGGMLIVDSVQAGLRAHGCLSIVDYPGFEGLPAPDMEAFAKAVNGGQYPISVLALSRFATNTYAPGTYGNTMTGNPRGLSVISRTLADMTPDVRENIRVRGAELREGLTSLQQRFPSLVDRVTGTGLLVAAELNPDRAPVSGPHGVGIRLRRSGIGFIRGGVNGLRFTPHFRITKKEVALIVSIVESVLAGLADDPVDRNGALV